MRLAAHLHKTHEELLDPESGITIEEFQRWLLLEQIEPFGEYGAWLRTGVIASTLANINRGKDTSPFSALDFMPEAYRPPKKVETPKTMKEKWISIMETQNALVRLREKQVD